MCSAYHISIHFLHPIYFDVCKKHNNSMSTVNAQMYPVNLQLNVAGLRGYV